MNPSQSHPSRRLWPKRFSSFVQNLSINSRSLQQDGLNSCPNIASSNFSQPRRQIESRNIVPKQTHSIPSRLSPSHPEQFGSHERDATARTTVPLLSHNSVSKRKSQDLDTLLLRDLDELYGSQDACYSVSVPSEMPLDLISGEHLREEFPQTVKSSTSKRRKHDAALIEKHNMRQPNPHIEICQTDQVNDWNALPTADNDFYEVDSSRWYGRNSVDESTWSSFPEYSYQSSRLGPSETDDTTENRLSIYSVTSSEYLGLDELDENSSWTTSVKTPPYRPTISPRNDVLDLGRFTFFNTTEDQGFWQQSSTPPNVDSVWEAHLDKSDSTGTHACAICHQSYVTASNLEIHAKYSGHRAFACTEPNCPGSYSRQDSFLRHCASHRETKQYPCRHCDKYEGAKAFKRRDHLTQHMRNCHPEALGTLLSRFCSEEKCPYSKASGSFKGFQERSEYTRHMRERHGKGIFECNEPGCKRVGRKGFARLNDLQKHKIKEHSRGQQISHDLSNAI